MKRKYVMAVASAAVVVGCATYVAPTREESMQVVKSSFRERGIAKMDRLDQSDLQIACSEAALTGKEVSKDVRARLEKQALATVKLPPDGVYLGDFKQGERIAQTGVGLQIEDALAEHRNDETFDKVKTRMRDFLARVDCDPIEVAGFVTHGSPIKAMLQLLSSETIDLSKFVFDAGNHAPTAGI